MALVVEDGTGLADANSYVSIADADTYFSDRANATWAAASDPEKTAALIRATSYLDGKYRSRYRGSTIWRYGQSLGWPRAWASDREGFQMVGVPISIKNATCEAALIFLATDIDAALERGGSVKQETVGPITTIFNDGAPVQTVYPAIDHAIMMALMGGAANLRHERG